MPKRKKFSARLRNLIAQAGGRFLGVQAGTPKIPDQVLFLDPQTGTTLALPLARVTSQAVAAEIERSRRAFAKAKSNTKTPRRKGR